MAELIDLTGQRFGRLVVIREGERTPQRRIKWLCQCDCGSQVVVDGVSLRRGVSQSCGCLRAELAKRKFTTHGGRSSRIYKIFHDAKQRCYNQSNPDYQHYGGRGIAICEAWLQDFAIFQDWALQSGYHTGLTLDRMDVDGPYSPENCRWVSMKVQQNNKRNNHRITFRGETHSISEWADITGIPYYTLHSRIVKLNWSVAKALTEPVQHKYHKR